MKENYIDLCCLNFGKRSYIIMRNSVKIMFFEKVDNNYEMPILSFNLYDNVGKSLTVVNQNFFMSQLINRLNIAFNKGILSTDKELKDYLSGIKVKAESDSYLKKIFKGSLMKEINEQNFESNKREIIKYLDGFKIGVFASYNNVSIFNGSIEKNDNVNIDENNSTAVNNSYNIDDFDFTSNRFDDVTFSNQVENSQIVQSDNVIESVQEDVQSEVQNVQENVQPEIQNVQEDVQPEIQNGESVQEQSVVQSVQTDVQNGEPVQEQPIVQNVDVQSDSSEAINSSDYFSSLNNISISNISYVDAVKKRLENNL